MAIIANQVKLSNGRVMNSAYIKATISGFDIRQCSLLLEVWENLTDRETNDPIDRQTLGIQNPGNITASNPLEYAYTLLKQQPQFSDATDA